MKQLLCVFVCVLGLVSGYPGGPPVATHPDICDSMAPSHGSTAMANNVSPYEVLVGSTCYSESVVVPVYFRVKDGEATYPYFEGLFLQARVSGTADNNTGTFTTDDSELQTLDCYSQTGSAIGQNQKKHWDCKKANWTPSVGVQEDIKFYVTGVKNKATYWVSLESDVLTYATDCQLPTTDAYDDTCIIKGQDDRNTGNSMLPLSLVALLTALVSTFLLTRA